MKVLNSIAYYLAQVLDQHGITKIVSSPGSRNAPVIQAFSLVASLNIQPVVDERSAAFMALGQSLALQKPAALLCTSGSALLNYAPAVAEAYYQKVPLLLITTDRPEAWIDQGDGQTIRQTEAFGGLVSARFLLRSTDDPDSRWHNYREINRACLALAQMTPGVNAGPVHLNFPLAEPLYEYRETDPEMPYPITALYNDPDTLDALIKAFGEARRIMVIAGQQLPGASAPIPDAIAQLPQVVTLSESTSNWEQADIRALDRTLVHMPDTATDELRPDILIYQGGTLVSKKIKQYLRKVNPKEVWRLAKEDYYPDTFQKLNAWIKLDPDLFWYYIGRTRTEPQPGYKQVWTHWSDQAREKAAQFYTGIPFCDLQVHHHVAAKLPSGTVIHTANSSVVRYLQLFDAFSQHPTYCNRGVNGIDGSSSTAVGIALAKPEEKHLLITGDLAFFYDSNALLSARQLKGFKILLINNAGGNIFRIIHGPDTIDPFTSHIESQHELQARSLAEMNQFRYYEARDYATFAEQFDRWLQDEHNSILEVFTPGDISATVLRNYFKNLKDGSEEKLDAD